jgi:ABC-type transport system involved in cytochrome c biogenesis ATPase subunit
MKLSFVSPNASITAFETIDLPKFTLITGINGSGKTHLLRCIEKGHVSTDVASANNTDIRFFDASSMIPNASAQADANATLFQRTSYLNTFRTSLPNFDQQVIQVALQLGLPAEALTSPRQVARLTVEELRAHLGDDSLAQQAHEQISQAMMNASRNAISQSGGDQRYFQALEEFVGLPVGAATDEEIDSLPLTLGTVDVFQQSFADLFLSYRHEYQKNCLKSLAFNDGHSTTPPLSNEEFEKEHLEAPWKFVNDTLAAANLDFSINHPSMYGTGPYLPILRKKGSDAEIRFEDLSSGEKVLMALTFCIYYTQDRRQRVSYPKLLLFDEIDAPLHPSRTKLLVKTIMDTLVEKHGIHVILTTHSPSTVAVVPPESVHAMQPEQPRLKKVTQRHAISLLTSEIPALSISFHGKRQVFVEDKNDADRYHQLFGDLYPYLKCNDRLLQFVGVGKKNKDGQTENAGCSQVFELVKSLASAGNETVFGLVDWDKSNEPTDRVFVLSKGIRYAIENCLLDPLLVLATLIREDRQLASDFGLVITSHTELRTLQEQELQAAINALQDVILKDEPRPRQCIQIRYRSGMSLYVAMPYLHYHGHTLETEIKKHFPKLKRHHQDGHLLLHIIKDVLPDHDGFIPIDLLNSFQQILDVEIS